MRGRDGKAGSGGFTLVEILVAIAILGILVTLAVSSFREFDEKYEVEAETKQLYADLMDARGRAMQRNRFHFVRFESSKTYATYEDSSPSPDGDGSFNAGDKLVVRGAAKHAIAAADFDFNRNGIATGTGSIRISFPPTTNPDYDCITIRETRIKMGKYDGTICVEK